MKNDVRLRQATRSDAPYILWLEEVCMKAYAVALWGTWRPSSSLEAVAVSRHQIIELAAKRIGCVAVDVTKDFVELKRLFIGPELQNRGIGADVLGRIREIARAEGVPVRLSVLTTNPALRFYLRHGFHIIGETPERRILVDSAP